MKETIDRIPEKIASHITSERKMAVWQAINPENTPIRRKIHLKADIFFILD